MEGLPATVAERLHALIYGHRAVAYLQVDAGLVLVGAGGHLEAYGLVGLRSGEAAVEQAFFLEGLLPPVETPYVVPSVEFASGRVADLHFLLDGDTWWVVLLDVSAERDVAWRMQQKAYDMTLAQEREALLNRRLEAANEALLATQRELEASRDALALAHDQVRGQAAELAFWNKTLEERVAAQLAEMERMARLKRFLAPQLAELIVSKGDEKILESHRREIVVVFCDLRGYTAFTETAEPEEVLDFLREYHSALGPLVSKFEGTLDQFSGDGIMVFFNDPMPCPDPAGRAVEMAIAMREEVWALIATWRERGRGLGFGAGIAQGYATLGQIGFSERSGYTAIGTVCNVAARLCAEAKDGEILISQRVKAALKENIAYEEVGALALKGLTQPVVAYNVPTCR